MPGRKPFTRLAKVFTSRRGRYTPSPVTPATTRTPGCWPCFYVHSRRRPPANPKQWAITNEAAHQLLESTVDSRAARSRRVSASDCQAMKRVDVLTLLVLGALWGGSYVFIRIGAPALGPLPLMAARVAAAAVVLLVATHASGHVSSLRSHASRLLVLGLINSALPSPPIATAELRLNASFVAVLGATAPLFAALLVALLQHERGR